jgi:microcystin-dependent protein
MDTQFLGQLMLAAFNFPPRGWAQCNGQLLPINQYTALFSLLGTIYGGDGTQNFALPNLQGRTAVSFGNGFVQGQRAGEDFHTLVSGEVPQHTHQLQGTAAAVGSPNPLNNMLGPTGNLQIYSNASGLQAMNGGMITNYGGSQGHENRQPFLVMNWCIALTGIFPTRN